MAKRQHSLIANFSYGSVALNSISHRDRHVFIEEIKNGYISKPLLTR